MPRALVGLGANLGDRARSLVRAIERIAHEAAQTQPVVSQMHETSPAGGPVGQDAFLNAAIVFETPLGPADLYAVLKRIELDLGRVRGERWGARAIDLDLLLYDEVSGDNARGKAQIVMTRELQVPHPRMSFRRFVLEPAAEVAPEMIHPVIGWSVQQLIDHLNQASPHVMVVGLRESHPAELALAAAAQLGAGYSAETALGEGVAVGSDPSGRALPRPIQFLDRVGSVLADAQAVPGETVISAFCVDRIGNAAHGVEATQPLKPSLLKLLVVLDDWESLVAARSSLVDVPGARVPGDAYRHELLRLAVHDYQGPVLCAGRAGFEAQLNEITAALVAMR